MLWLRSDLTDEESIKITFDEESNIDYKESDVDVASDEEDDRDPAWASSELTYTFFDHSVVNQPSAKVVFEKDLKDEEPPDSSKRLRAYSSKQPAASISTKRTDSYDTTSERGLGVIVAIRLCCGLERKNAKVYFNNLFTSITLVETLTNENIYTIGALRVNRLGDAVNKLVGEKEMEKKDRGSASYATSAEGITVLRWKGNDLVHICSS
ncbi:hypothetical protein QYM36_001086 [Artemia franciscana]|uniref:PiggyBac transposable element-derived protein domain-containing protein n=1 Tax=Artemia franciscana TaxID=6661 RepID=A0AA88I9M5_ARTSF|nr:hypothetical protein QYM36_001086 [Artemia franciscana]